MAQGQGGDTGTHTGSNNLYLMPVTSHHKYIHERPYKGQLVRRTDE